MARPAARRLATCALLVVAIVLALAMSVGATTQPSSEFEGTPSAFAPPVNVPASISARLAAAARARRTEMQIDDGRSFVESHAMLGVGVGTAATGTNINVNVHAELTDPITKLLHSKWVWLLFAIILLILICVVAYCFRDQVAVCVACTETCMYHTAKTLLLPFKILMQGVRACFYPFKQCFLATKDRCTRCCYPSHTRVAGLRY